MIPRLRLFPVTARVNSQQHLEIGGCDTVGLANEFDTPLYLFDEAGLRAKCAEFKNEFGQRYRDTTVIYACKAFINQALATILNEEGFGLDVVSAGELYIAQSSGLPLERVYYHGNNKSAEELRLALDRRVGRIVVDNFPELTMLSEIARERETQPDILLRLSPGVDPHTHQYITTGTIDSKFGFPMSAAEEAIAQAIKAPNLNLVGLHCHIGSLIFEVEPYLQTIEVVLGLAAQMKAKYGFELSELNIGGGFAIQYTLDRPAPPVSDYAVAITTKIVTKCQELQLAQPRLVIEPGRSVVGQSGVALYRVGVIKDIPQVRCYVSVDGGMGDNIRPALYQAEYEAMVANKMPAEDTAKVTLAGRFCESGDVLIRDIMLPPLKPGDTIAVPSCGAYCLPMASNYNASLKPAVVLVKDGNARLIRRRETFADLTGCDLT